MHEQGHDERSRVVAFYAGEDESARLHEGEGRVELLRTQELLRAVLPAAPARVLDVGGAAGVHAAWLAGDGHDVEVVDLVPGHVEQARSLGLAARLGDARSLPVDDGTVDAVLLLGPLYHLRSRADRLQALTEARRALRPGGLLAAAAVSRIAAALDLLRKGSFDDPGPRAAAERIAATGVDGTALADAVFWFHTAEGLAEEIGEAGFTAVDVRGVEGPAWPLMRPRDRADDGSVDRVLAIARLADADPSTVGASAHLLALATA